MQNKKLITVIILLSIFLLSSVVEGKKRSGKRQNHDKGQVEKQEENSEEICPPYKLISCANKIKKSVKACSSEEDAIDCLDQLLYGHRCYDCLDKVLPHFLEAENYRKNRTSQQQNEEFLKEGVDINNVIHKYATCGTQEIFQCKSLINQSYRECEKTTRSKNSAEIYKCMNNYQGMSQCSVCICTIKPQICEKQAYDNRKDSEDSNDDEGDQKFGFLRNINKQVKEEEEKRGRKISKEEEKQFDLNGLFGELGNLVNKSTLQGLGKIAQAFSNSKSKKDNKKETGKNSNGGRNSISNILHGLMQNPQRTKSLLDALQVDERELERDDSSMEDIQQVMMEKIMSNPELLEQFLQEEQDQKRLGELLGTQEEQEQGNEEDNEGSSQETEQDADEKYDNELYDQKQDSIYDRQCSNDKQYEMCKWKILKILPSCVNTDAQKCLRKLLQRHPCTTCICRVVPIVCNEK